MKVIQLYTNEKKLIEKAAQGDRKAQRRLYDKHAGKMLSVCRQYISPIETAEEIMLNGFFKVFTKLETFNHEGSFEGWVRRIMIRECLNFLRKKDPFKWSSEIDEGKFEDEPEEEAEDVPLDQIQQCIDQLPDGYKSVFVMYVIDGLKHHEIATMLGISENTSKSQFRKARLLLQEEINEIKKKRYEA
ncbi:RNA polymerase sigma-70 factor [Nonlabens sp. YIK11]|uniref:RNA polymerase sigma factor n=1 Tax=Nonlabens sp. YIK11 TaxID=1453349 RepID=UPI0006DCC1C0|nr:RNA polymerase sigma-70 factor [Nonlabens sp. YIK11]